MDHVAFPNRIRNPFSSCLVLLACLLTMTGCQKEIISVLLNTSLPSFNTRIEQLIPDISNAVFTREAAYESFTIKNPDIDFYLGLDSMWIDAQRSDYTIPLPECTIQTSNDAPIMVPFSFSDSLFLHNLHWPDQLKEFSSASCSGTMTIHISFPSELPFEKVLLHPTLTSFVIPDFLYLVPSKLYSHDLTFEAQTDGNHVTVIHSGVEIPREGVDITINEISIKPKATDLGFQEDGKRFLRGCFRGSGVLVLSPEDARSFAAGNYTANLGISISFSDLRVDNLFGHMNDDMFELQKTVKVPFQRLQDNRLNHYSGACLLVSFSGEPYTYDKFGYSSGLTYYSFVQRFFSIKDGETFGGPAIGTPYPYPGGSVMYLQEEDGIARPGISNENCPKLKKVFSVLPDSLGVCVTCNQTSEYLIPGRTDHFRYSSTWYIPLFFKGTYWGIIFNTQPVDIREMLDNAVPGTEMYFSGKLDNQTPFNAYCTPVFIDDLGYHQEITDAAFEIRAFDSIDHSTFSFQRTVPKGKKDEYLYLKLEFRECNEDRNVRAGQSIKVAFDKIYFKKYN